MMHKHTKTAGQRKVSPPGPTYMSHDQIGELATIYRDIYQENA